MNTDANNVPRAIMTHDFKRNAKLSRKLLPALIVGCFACAPVWANPTGAQVVAGQVNISNNGNVLTVTNSPGSIINWQSFSINPGELTQFLQQSSSSAVLNRIVGQNPTQIFGALQSNGKVYLINPNGILFGANSQVNVSGLVASSLDISNADFQAGKLNFSGTQAGAVSNQGSITTPSGGQVYLIAPQVQNNGIITSPQGEVLLAAGHSVQLIDGGDPNMQVVISAPTDQALNLGSVVAQGGKIGIYGALVNQNGIVNADSAVVGQNGQIVFKSSQTTMLAASSQTTATGMGTGGSVYLLGPQVGLTDHAMVDVSGQTGGGTVLVGGDFHGSNPTVMNATATYVGSNASIKADAIQTGNGGNVAVWSNGQTRMVGDISVQGGAQGGNGGFVETSSAQYLDVATSPNLAAPHGKGGQWLLDPDAITITSGSSVNISGATPFSPTTPGTVSTLPDTVLAAAIATGGTVTVDTTGTLAGTGNITITGATALGSLNAGASATLNLYAYNDINVNSTIANTGMPLAINIVANKYGSGATGVVNVADGVYIQANNANVSISGNAINIGTSTGATVSTGNVLGQGNGSASLSLTATNGAITVNTGSSLLANSGINLSATGGDITVNGSVGYVTLANLAGLTTMSTTGAITTGAASTIDNAIVGGGNVGLKAGTGMTLGGAINATGGTVALTTAAGNIAQGGLGAPGITATDLSAVATTGYLSLNSESNVVGTLAGSANSTSGIDFNNSAPFSIGPVGAIGAILAQNGLTSLSGTTYSMQLDIPSGTGGITINGPINSGSYKVLLISGSGAIVQQSTDQITGNGVVLTSGTTIGTLANPILTNTSNLSVSASGAVFVNNGVTPVNINGAGSSGAVTINSVGALSVPSCACDGTPISANSITFTSQGAINIGSNTSIGDMIDSSGGNISLSAGYTPGSGFTSAATLTQAGNLVSSSGTITLAAGGAISQTGVSNPTATINQNQFTPPPPPPPPTILVYVTGETATSRTYDGTTIDVLSGGQLTGLATGDSATFTQIGSFGSKNVGTGLTVTANDKLTVTGDASGDTYVLVEPTGLTANITPATLRVTGQSAVGKVYDGNTTATITGGQLSGLIGTDNVTLTAATSGTFGSKNVGTNLTVTPTTIDSINGTDSSNYTLIQPTLTANITPLALTVTGQITANDKTYNGNTTAIVSGGTLSGMIPGDNVFLNGTGTFATKNVGSNIAVTQQSSLSGTDSGNYTLPATTLTANITPATLNISGEVANSKTYDGTVTATLTGGLLSGAVPGDNVNFSGIGSFASKNVGTNIPISLAGSLIGSDSSNYTLAQPANLTATIMPKTITVTATGQPIVYNGSTVDPVTLGSVGVVLGDNVNFSSTGANFANANVGTNKTVTVTGISAGGIDGSNYSVNNSATTTANITPATLMVVGEIAQNKVYDGTTAATLIGGSLSGVVIGDAGNVALTQTGNFASSNVGNGIAVTASDSLSGSAAGNYTLVQPTGLAANIVPATAVTQATPTILASNSYIIAINTESTTLLNSGTSSTSGGGSNSSGSSSGGNGNGNGNSGTTGSGTNNSGATNNGNVKKLYCN